MRRDETSTFRSLPLSPSSSSSSSSSSSFPLMFVLLLSSPVALLLRSTEQVWLGASRNLKLFSPVIGSTT